MQALHAERVDSMRANFEFINTQKEFSNQILLKRYFACIEEGLRNITISRQADYSKKWLQQYLTLEKEVMRHYGLAKSGESQ